MRWMVLVVLLGACASARPVPQESDEAVKARLDAEHREAQADYDRAEQEHEQR